MKKNQLRVTHGKNGVSPLPVVNDDETVNPYSRLDEKIGLLLLTLPLELEAERRRSEGGGAEKEERR